MKALAKLQAVAIKFTDEEKAYFKSHPYVPMFEAVFNLNKQAPFIAMVRQIAGEQLKDQVDQLEGILPELVDVKILEELPKSLGSLNASFHSTFSGGSEWRLQLAAA
ncbi:hypothetical protein COOONC_07774 [Cooperia oncophora]